MDFTDYGVDLGLYTLTVEKVASMAFPHVPDEMHAFKLHANHPNPFNPRTTIRYDLAMPATVTLRIFDAVGRLLNVLVAAEEQPAGGHEVTWTGRDIRGRAMPSGIYFYRLEADGFVDAKPMVLLRPSNW